MRRSEYLSKSWLDPRIEIREVSISGKGMFATAPIAVGERVVIWGGKQFSREQVDAGKSHSQVWIGEETFLGSDADDPETDPSDFMNHSCQPNVWLVDEVTLSARLPIEPGDELTIDYALFEGEESFVMHWRCACGEATCRETITGRDWRLPELQQRYFGHFSPFLNERIRVLNERMCG